MRHANETPLSGKARASPARGGLTVAANVGHAQDARRVASQDDAGVMVRRRLGRHDAIRASGKGAHEVVREGNGGDDAWYDASDTSRIE